MHEQEIKGLEESFVNIIPSTADVNSATAQEPSLKQSSRQRRTRKDGVESQSSKERQILRNSNGLSKSSPRATEEQAVNNNGTPSGLRTSSEGAKKNWSQRLTTKRLGDMVAVMKDNTRGIRLQEVTYKWKHYPYCFSGKAFVDWVMGSVQGWESREEATKLGELMMAKGIFKGINSKTATSSAVIDDAACYYTFQVDDFIAQLNNKMMQDVVGKMKHEKYGIQVKDRKYLLQTYPNTFVGSEAVDWMVENIFIKTRREAVELGQVLMNNGFICHSTQKMPFCDGYQFYCFADKTAFKRGYLSIKEEQPMSPAIYSRAIRNPDFNNFSKRREKDNEGGCTASTGSQKGEKLRTADFKLFWCCIKGDHLWCYMSPRSPQPHTSIRLSTGIALKVVHKQCGKQDASLHDKCRFEILTCYEGKQYILIPKTCKKMEKWAGVLYDYSMQGENDLMEEAEQSIESSMLDRHRLWLEMRDIEKRSLGGSSPSLPPLVPLVEPSPSSSSSIDRSSVNTKTTTPSSTTTTTPSSPTTLHSPRKRFPSLEQTVMKQTEKEEKRRSLRRSNQINGNLPTFD